LVKINESLLILNRDYKDFIAPGSKSTIDKPKFEIAGHGLGAIDISINQ